MLKRNMMCSLLAAGLLWNFASAADAKKAAQLDDGGVQAVLESQIDGLAADENVQNAETVIDDYIDRKGYETDTSKKVIFAKGVGKVVLTGDIAGLQTSIQRDIAGSMAMIDARMKIMMTIAGSFSGEQLYDVYDESKKEIVPENVQKDYDAFLENAKAIFAAAQKDDLIQRVEDKELSGQLLIETIDQVGGADEAIAENKALRTAYLNAQKAMSNIKEELSSFKSDIERASRLVIIGTSVLAQAESIEKNEKGQNELKVAVLMVWSDKLMQGASAILEGKDVTFAPDKKGRKVREWLRTQNPATIVGGRQFIDKDGKMWFLGASSRIRKGTTVEQRKAEKAAQSTASSNVVFFLISDAEMHDSVNQSMKTYKDLTGMESNDANEKVAESFRQSYNDLQIKGIHEIIAREYHHPLLNRNTYVAIYGVNTGDVTALTSIRDNFYKTAKRINTAQERERGKVAELQKQYEASKDNPVARAEGAAEAKEIMTEKKTDGKVLDVKKGKEGKIRTGVTAPKDDDEEDTF